MSDFDRFTDFLLEASASYHAPPETPRDAIWASIESSMGGGGESAEPAESEAAFVAAAASYHEPPVTPHEEMWGRIGPAWELRRSAGVQVREPDHARRRVVMRWVTGLAIAASLVIAVAMGRNPDGRKAAGPNAAGSFTARGAQVAAATPQAAPRGREVAVRYATAKHLGRVETLLASFRADAARAEAAVEVSGWARALLGETRLLLDTPVERAPRESALLRELELVLAQIATLTPESPGFERDLVVAAIARQGTISRLRAAASPGST